jgi:hypothetical protein
VFFFLLSLFVAEPAWCQIGCLSQAETNPGPHCWLVCPHGDGPRLDELPGDATITVTVLNLLGNPLEGITGANLWLIGAHDELVLCGGASSIDADYPTDDNGQTTFTGAIKAGGCDYPLHVVVAGTVLLKDDCSGPIDVDIRAVSPDIDGDLVVNLTDFSAFGAAWGGAYNPCVDFNCDGSIGLVDFSLFAQHWMHGCP